jgi:hypothetical protein
MGNKYYLKSVKLIDNPSEGRLYYELEYSNGISTKIINHLFSENLIINIMLES